MEEQPRRFVHMQAPAPQDHGAASTAAAQMGAYGLLLHQQQQQQQQLQLQQHYQQQRAMARQYHSHHGTDGSMAGSTPAGENTSAGRTSVTDSLLELRKVNTKLHAELESAHAAINYYRNHIHDIERGSRVNVSSAQIPVLNTPQQVQDERGAVMSSMDVVQCQPTSQQTFTLQPQEQQQLLPPSSTPVQPSYGHATSQPKLHQYQHQQLARKDSSSDLRQREEDRAPGENTPKGQSRYWAPDEHRRFLDALDKYGPKEVRAIANYVKTRNATQVRTHAQKYFLRVARESKGPMTMNERSRRSMSEGDLTRLGRQIAAKKGSETEPHDEALFRNAETEMPLAKKLSLLRRQSYGELEKANEADGAGSSERNGISLLSFVASLDSKDSSGVLPPGARTEPRSQGSGT